MFAMLLPNRSPTARSGAPASDALMTVATSGSDVAPASRSIPTTSPPSPVRSAIWSPDLARTIPAATTTAEASAKAAIRIGMGAPIIARG